MTGKDSPCDAQSLETNALHCHCLTGARQHRLLCLKQGTYIVPLFLLETTFLDQNHEVTDLQRH